MKNIVISFELSSFRKDDFTTNMHLNKTLGVNCISSFFDSVIVFFVGRRVSLSKEQVSLIIKDADLLTRLEKKGIKKRLIEMMSGENVDARIRPSPSKPMVQKQIMNPTRRNEEVPIGGNQQVKDQKTMTPENVELSSIETEMFQKMQDRHKKLLGNVRNEEKKSLLNYKRHMDGPGNNDAKEMGKTCKGKSTTFESGGCWIGSNSDNFSVQSASAFLKCKSELNNALKDDFSDSSFAVSQILESVERCIDTQMSDKVPPSSTPNPHAKQLRDVKSAVLHDLGVYSVDDFAKNMTREAFKQFQNRVENEVLHNICDNKTFSSMMVNSLMDSLAESIKNISSPSCTWLSSEEINLINHMGGFDNLSSVKQYVSKEDNEVLKKIEDAKREMQKNNNEASQQSDVGKVKGYDLNSINPIDPDLIEKSNEILQRIEKDEKTLESIRNKLKNHANQNEVTKYKEEFARFLENEFNTLWNKVGPIIKTYAKYRIKKNMITFSDKQPIPDDVINFSANKYELKKGDGIDAYYLFNPQNDKSVMWSNTNKCFLEGCTQKEAEKSYSENKPLLCLYDELCFFPKVWNDINVEVEVEVEVEAEAEYPKGKSKNPDPPVIISHADEVLNINYSAPYTKVMMKDLEQKVFQLETACKRNKEYQEEVLQVLASAYSDQFYAKTDSSEFIDIGSKYKPPLLQAKFDVIFSDAAAVFTEPDNIIIKMEENNNEYPIWEVISMEVVKICYDIVDDHVQKSKKDMDNVICDIYGEKGLRDDALKKLKKDMYKLRFNSWDDKWDTSGLKEMLFKDVLASMDNMDKNENSALLDQNPAIKTDMRNLSNKLMKYINGRSTEEAVPEITYLKVFIEQLCDLFYTMRYQDPAMTFLWLPQGTVLTNEMIEKFNWKPVRGKLLRTAKVDNGKGLPLEQGQVVEITTYPCMYLNENSVLTGGNILTKERIDFVPDKKKGKA
ncbi:MAG: hypothetical protein KAG53_07035 [Endozoicomonadaceae bacterium]|nr:hypothetical protein [Endozoicomonadaceae bacterium]